MTPEDQQQWQSMTQFHERRTAAQFELAGSLEELARRERLYCQQLARTWLVSTLNYRMGVLSWSQP